MDNWDQTVTKDTLSNAMYHFLQTKSNSEPEIKIAPTKSYLKWNVNNLSTLRNPVVKTAQTFLH